MRATDDGVKEICPTDVSTAPWLTMAANVVDRHLAGQYDEATLCLIETNLAAHFIRLTIDRDATVDDRGTATVTYTGNTDAMGLKGTTYGQLVMMLDDKGILEQLERKTATMEVF